MSDLRIGWRWRRVLIGLSVALAVGSVGGLSAWGQGDQPAETMDPLDEPDVESEAVKRLRELRDTGDAEDEEERESLPRFEFYKAQIAPSDVLPKYKPGHWSMLTLQLQANHDDYQGRLRTAPVTLRGMPKAVVFRRESRLIRGQPMNQSWPIFLPGAAKRIDVELARPRALRPDDRTQVFLSEMPPHQMQIVILAENPNQYAGWARIQATIPATTDLGDPVLIDKKRYYRVVLSTEPERPNLSPHPLTWTTISHVVWDDLDPNVLTPGQRQALIDWLHWGGQLIVAGGASRTLALISDEESFLAPYLPGVPTGESVALDERDLRPLAIRHPPPNWKYDVPLEDQFAVEGGPGPALGAAGLRHRGGVTRYSAWRPIEPPPDQPLYLAALRATHEDAAPIRLAGDAGPILGLERRVGRGRILMLGFDPNEPALLAWRGYPTLVRRLMLRRPEDPWNPRDPDDFTMLDGRQLSWYRLLGRDLGAPALDDSTRDARPRRPSEPIIGLEEEEVPPAPVAAWLDEATLPSQAGDALKVASGIEVPGSRFVLNIMIAYVVALVPLNWLICRFVLRRRELAWVVAPLLALGFAGAVERGAAIDMGYDRACDEIDLIELQPNYERAHLSRFEVFYSTGRENFAVSFPNDPTALALPLNTGLALRGEEITESVWQATAGPDDAGRELLGPALLDFRVEPRSLAMLRAEQMVELGGRVGLRSTAEGDRQLVNASPLDLRDAVIVDVGAAGPRLSRFRWVGDLPPGAIVDWPETSLEGAAFFEEADLVDGADAPDWLDLEPFLEPLLRYNWKRPEDAGELRLVAWTPEPFPGQKIEPAVDRHRGFTLVVAHLAYGPPPSPDTPRFDQAPSSVRADDAGVRADDAGRRNTRLERRPADRDRRVLEAHNDSNTR